jgi:hypothetical protein
MTTPVYQVTIKDYQFNGFSKNNKKSKKIVYAITPWHGIKIPKSFEENKPNFAKIGKKIDSSLKKHFLGKKVAIRVIGSEEHKNKSINDLIKIIKKIGHDRYDPKRKGDRYKTLGNKHIDFFALDFKVKTRGEYFKHFIEPFYYWPISNQGKPIRIDIAIVYDLNQLKVVEHQYKGREDEIKKDGFIFKYQERKKDAVLGIIKIL